MKNKIAILSILVVVLLLFGCTQTPTQNNNQNYSQNTGRLVVSLTDAAANLNTIEKINLTIDSVKVYSDTNGWASLNIQPRTVDLLDLNATNTTILLVDQNIQQGNYSQIEIGVQSAVIVDKNGASSEAKVPSNRFKVISNTRVDANSTTAISLDVLAGESLHVTGNGKYIFAPVVNISTTTNAKVDISANNKVTISGGNKTEAKFGMNVSGDVVAGVGITPDTDLGIDSGGNIVLPVDINGGIGNGADNNIDINIGGVGIGIGTSENVDVAIRAFAFAGKEIRIKEGTTVVWTNFDAVGHTVTSDSGTELDSPLLQLGETYSHTFNTKGTYEYYCKPHPAMRGKVIVE
jgi:amicyanin